MMHLQIFKSSSSSLPMQCETVQSQFAAFFLLKRNRLKHSFHSENSWPPHTHIKMRWCFPSPFLKNMGPFQASFWMYSSIFLVHSIMNRDQKHKRMILNMKEGWRSMILSINSLIEKSLAPNWRWPHDLLIMKHVLHSYATTAAHVFLAFVSQESLNGHKSTHNRSTTKT